MKIGGSLTTIKVGGWQSEKRRSNLSPNPIGGPSASGAKAGAKWSQISTQL